MSTKQNPVEVAFRKHGGEWKRRVFKTQAALERWFDKNGEEVAEVRCRDVQ